MTDRRRAPWPHLAVMLLAASAGLPSATHAATGVAAVLATDYLTQGYSRSADRPSLQLNVDVQRGDWYWGAWLSQVDFDDRLQSGAHLEFGPYIGRLVRLDDAWRLELLLGGYFYEAPIGGRTAHYVEGYALLHYEDLATLQVSAIPDAYGTGQPTGTAELSARYPLARRLELTATAGYALTRRWVGYDRVNWQAGLVWRTDWGNVGLRYHGGHDLADVAPDRWDHDPHDYSGRVVLSITLGRTIAE